MALLVLEAVSKSFGQQVLLREAVMRLDRGERVGLIGDNGTGKSTLLRIIEGEVEPDAGRVNKARGAQLGYLTQDPNFDPANTLIDEAEAAFAELHDMAHRLRELEHRMADAGEGLEGVMSRYERVRHEYEAAGGYAWHHKLEATLEGVGLPQALWETPVDKLSGGQRSRLQLAKLLVSEPEILLLDEPTNHLDLAGIEWLEGYLLRFAGAVLLVSHDRYLLDRVATRICWLDNGLLRSYPGNYAAFVRQREVAELSQQRALEKQQAFIAKEQSFINRFRAGQRSREAKGREKRLTRLLASDAIVDPVRKRSGVRLSFAAEAPGSRNVLRVAGLRKSYGKLELWQELAFAMQRGERLGIVGPNGCGKTTLLRCLVGEADADEGEVRWGSGLSVGYYDQRLEDFDPGQTVLEAALEGRDDPIPQVRAALGTMRFDAAGQEKPMGALSGGERARVALVRLLLERPNVLVMDEPTNHLDISSREALERALRAYDGTILAVTHDRYFLSNVTQRLLIFDAPGSRPRDFLGSWRDWIIDRERHTREQAESPERMSRASAGTSSPTRAAASAPSAASSARAPAGGSPDTQARPANKYLRPFGTLSIGALEERITETEIALADVQEQFGDASTMSDPATSRRLQDDFARLSRELEQLEEEYFSREEA